MPGLEWIELKNRTDELKIGDMAMSGQVCFAYSVNSTVSADSAKLWNHNFLNGGGKHVQYMTKNSPCVSSGFIM